MVCIYCHHPDTRVTNSRTSRQSPRVWRRRSCPQCHAVMTTYETPAEQEMPRVQSGRQSRPFSTWRLMSSLYKALPEDKTTRSDSAHALAETIRTKIMRDNPTILTPAHIAIVTHETLTAYNKKSAIYYALKHDILSISY